MHKFYFRLLSILLFSCSLTTVKASTTELSQTETSADTINLDLQELTELNQEAQTQWEHYKACVADGSESQAIHLYKQKTKCPDARIHTEVQNYKNKVRTYLSSAFDVSQKIRKNTLNIHPFFSQVIFEIISDNYPYDILIQNSNLTGTYYSMGAYEQDSKITPQFVKRWTFYLTPLILTAPVITSDSNYTRAELTSEPFSSEVISRIFLSLRGLKLIGSFLKKENCSKLALNTGDGYNMLRATIMYSVLENYDLMSMIVNQQFQVDLQKDYKIGREVFDSYRDTCLPDKASREAAEEPYESDKAFYLSLKKVYDMSTPSF